MRRGKGDKRVKEEISIKEESKERDVKNIRWVLGKEKLRGRYKRNGREQAITDL